MKELRQSFQNETAKKISETIGFDSEDMAASAAALYLQHDEIVEAREHISSHIADTWFLDKEQQFKPTRGELNDGVLVFTATVAHEAGKLLPEHRDELAYFWSEIGTAIIGAEVEIKIRTEHEVYPITTDIHPQKNRSARDRFHRAFEERLSRLEKEETVVFSKAKPLQRLLAAD